MKSVKLFLVLIFLCGLMLPSNTNPKEVAAKAPVMSSPIKFGTIPVLQSLPLFVASEKGFFKEQDLSVEVVLFSSAMEKDIALTSGQIVGYFGDHRCKEYPHPPPDASLRTGIGSAHA